MPNSQPLWQALQLYWHPSEPTTSGNPLQIDMLAVHCVLVVTLCVCVLVFAYLRAATTAPTAVPATVGTAPLNASWLIPAWLTSTTVPWQRGASTLAVGHTSVRWANVDSHEVYMCASPTVWCTMAHDNFLFNQCDSVLKATWEMVKSNVWGTGMMMACLISPSKNCARVHLVERYAFMVGCTLFVFGGQVRRKLRLTCCYSFLHSTGQLY